MNGSQRICDQRSFLVLPENRLAVAAVKRLAPGIKRRTVRQVTLVGPPGSGKSHLARELLRGWQLARGDGKLLLVTASEFAAQFAEASTAGAISQFQTRYRNDVRLLICEDVQALVRRQETQQQLLAAMDDIISQGGLVLLTSTRMPGAMNGLDRRLVNRLHGGLCVTMKLPGADSRRRLIEQFLASESISLSPAEIDLIVAENSGSQRELLGLLQQLQAEESWRTTDRSNRDARLKSMLQERTPTTEIDLEEIARATAARFGVKLSDLKGPRRSQTISLARQTAMYLARELGGLNYAQIGAFFNRGNHSTVIHACRKVAVRMRTDGNFAPEVRQLRVELTANRRQTARRKR